MNFKKLRSIVIEDEDAIRLLLKELIDSSDEMEVVADVDSVDTAYQAIKQMEPDVLFLDIKLRGGDASMLIRKLKVNHIVIPPIIIMTAFSDKLFGIFEYRDHIIHALPKPFFDDWDNKFLICLEKIQEERSQQHKHKKGFYLLEKKNIIRQIPIDDIVYFKSNSHNGTTDIFIEGSKLNETTHESLTNILSNRLSHYPQFERIHQSCVINKYKILGVKIAREYKEFEVSCNGTLHNLRIGDKFQKVVDDYKALSS